MADLTVSEKYPDSWRLDHPDFSDVYKTVYSKGVITEFQQLQDDPIEVAPLVKVEVEGVGESDWIPLFFHPKPQYWDDDHKATDFNQKGKYFEKAWMSFRESDEIVVMLRAPAAGGELEPFAALAFADGVPRIGEDIIKIEMEDINDATPRSLHLQASKETTYGDLDEEMKGPDDLVLNLKQDCERIIYEEEMDTSTRTWNFMNPPAWYQYAQWNADNQVKQFHWDESVTPRVCICDALQFSEVWMQAMDLKAVVQEFLVPVGPILYLFQFLGYEREPSKYWGLLFIGCHHFVSGFGHCANDMAIETDELCFGMPGPDGRGNLLACPNVEQISFLGYGTYDPVNASKTIGYIIDAKVKAAPYSKELFEKMQGVSSQISPMEAYHLRVFHGQDWSNQYEEFTEQVQFSQYLSWLQKLQPYASLFETDLSSILLSVRPHTKEELQEAGMWPT